MHSYKLQFKLLSAATFGRGDGVPGLVDREVEHDAFGLPVLRGRTLKGLLAEECANILFALEKQGRADHWKSTAHQLFGSPGSVTENVADVRIGDARPPEDLRKSVKAAIENRNIRLTPDDVLESLTAIRRQTSMNEYGAPEHGSLRSMRVILPGTVFEVDLDFDHEPNQRCLALLAACILAWRRAGTGRNRGRGRLSARLLRLDGVDITEEYYRVFAEEVMR